MNQWLLAEGILGVEVQILKLIKLRNTGVENREDENKDQGKTYLKYTTQRKHAEEIQTKTFLIHSVIRGRGGIVQSDLQDFLTIVL